MAQIMELFSAELADFVEAYEKEYWRVDFYGEKYPPRIVMERMEPPLFMQGEDEAPGGRGMIQIIGRPEMQVVTSGKLQIGKKDLTKMVNSAGNLLGLFLHGFMQECDELKEGTAR